MGCSSSSDAPTRKTSTCSTGSSSRTGREMSFYHKYVLGRKLGQGSYGQVRAATSVSGEKVAVKVQHVKGDGKSRKAWDILRNESKMWQIASDHPQVVTFFEAFETKSPPTYYIVIEVCQASVLDGLKSDSSLITCFSRCFREMLLGLGHIHSRSVVHRDVKPDNFLLGGKDGQTTKLTDFGLATMLPKKGNIFTEAGSSPYMSPELLNKEGYRERTDIWSLGATAYIMLFGQYPYMPAKLNNLMMKESIRKNSPSPSYKPSDPEILVPAGGDAFVKILLQRNPKQRCSAEEALRLDFVQPRAIPAPEVPVETEAVVLAENVSEETELEQPVSSQACLLSGASEGPSPMGSKVGSAHRNALSAAKALSRTGEFKRRADPTVERDLDELLQRLQAQYEVRGATPNGTDSRFSKRSFTGSALDADMIDASLADGGDGEKNLGEQEPPLSQVPTPGRKRSQRHLSAAGWERRGTTWSVGDVPADGAGQGLAEVPLLDDAPKDRVSHV